MNRTGLIVALVVAAVTGLAFGAYPELDLRIARYFYDVVDANKNSFAWRIYSPLMLARDAGLWIGTLLIAPAVIALVVKLILRRYRATDLRGKFLVLAATNDRKVNASIAAQAKKLGILVNVADAPEECDFIVPARVREGNLQIALSTGGENPRVAKAMRKSMESLLGQFREKI